MLVQISERLHGKSLVMRERRPPGELTRLNLAGERLVLKVKDETFQSVSLGANLPARTDQADIICAVSCELLGWFIFVQGRAESSSSVSDRYAIATHESPPSRLDSDVTRSKTRPSSPPESQDFPGRSDSQQ
eukprot:Protomagalhaensia_sp_Gyna_25__5258@NODE_645_length_2921_cov_24_765094_g502_i0_p3_GENE_NODE_645_length_2921_cov_24_765094_g502_i0NODE_645_length_2921_cov_24_765094_g502_i0_p3_ORF_typecomplete_len132_score2_37IMS_C/PF11799_8/0_098_NODE_645_length_2921_cov_24_765094_g502_i0125520